MTDALQVQHFQPIALHVRDLGPFQGRTETVDFTDEESKPCNLFLLLSKNGRGKTNLLESLSYLLGMLDPRRAEDAAVPLWLRDHRQATLQLDLRAVLSRGAGGRAILISIVAGRDDDPQLRSWSPEQMEEIRADSWIRIGYGGGHRPQLRHKILVPRDDEALLLYEDLRRFLTDAQERPPAGFEDSVEQAPTQLFFTANRDIVRTPDQEERSITRPRAWDWHLQHRFDQEGQRWIDSLDNLLVWMDWLRDGRLERAQKLINERVFRGTSKFLEGVRKDPPEAMVNNENSRHRLDQLSSGERSMVQLLLRLGAHMTLNTWLVIDEMDIHLHPGLEHRMMKLFKELVENNPGLTIIATAQSREILQGFAFHLNENRRGIRKGGHLLVDDMNVEQDTELERANAVDEEREEPGERG